MVGLLDADKLMGLSMGLGLLGNMFRPPRYSTNIAEATAPDNSGFNNMMQMGLLARQARRDKLLEAQALRQQRKDDAELAELERKKQLRQQGATLMADPNLTLSDPRLRAYAAEMGDLGTALGLMKPQKSNLLNVAPGASLYDPDTGKPVYSAPVKPDTYSPEAFRQKLEIARAGAQPLPAATEEQRTRMAEAEAKARAAAQPPPRLTGGDRKELSELGAVASTFKNLTGGFDDSFAGYKSDVAGDFALQLGRKVPGAPFAASPEATNWWQTYQEQKNLVRNKLFGSALTVTERNEFDKAQITPGMAPKIIRKNLARQEEVAMKAASKIANSMLAEGARPEAVEAALGFKLNELDVKAPTKTPPKAEAKRLKYNPQKGTLE